MGFLKVRSRSGLCLLKTITDADTMMKAASIPVLTSSAISVMGKKSAITMATTPPMIILFMEG
ncbi:MAG: hypothetical protein ABFC12_04690 [Methanobacterium sp.]